MALTSLTNLVPIHVHSIGISTFDGSVSVGGTLSYEDVTNIDSVGIVTARTGIKVLAGGINAVGVVTATSFVGNGSNLTGISGVSVANQADNRLITATGTTDALNGEANLTFSGNTLDVNNIVKLPDDGTVHFGVSDTAYVRGKDSTDGYLKLGTAGLERARIHADGEVEIKAAANGQTVLSCAAAYASGSTVNIQTWERSDGAVKAALKYSHGANSMNMGTTTNHPFTLRTNDAERLRVDSSGRVMIGTTTEGAADADDLTLYSSSGWTGLTLRSRAADTAGGAIYFSDATSGGGEYDGYITYSQQYRKLYFGTAQTEKVSIDSTGHMLPGSNNSQNLGSTSTRWANLYVNDLQLSNEAKKDEGGNDVDGTWGDWTLQEGESDIYMINNRTGKKYSMVLKEVS